MTSDQHRRLAAIALVATVVAGITSLQARSDGSRDKKVEAAASQSAKAAKAFEGIMQEPEKSIPADVLARAKAIVVFPQVLKIAFAVGGEGGRGVVSRRVNSGWGQPVFLRGGGGSFGPQVGASLTDFFLLLMTDESIEGLMKDKFELGAEVGVAAGPVGKYHGAGTDATMQAQILSYSRSRGLFAGVNVKGVVLKPEDDLNTAVYNKTARQLLSDQIGGGGDADARLASFPRTLGRYAVSASDQR